MKEQKRPLEKTVFFKRLIRRGNSSALILPKKILDFFGLKEGGMIQIRVEGEVLVLSPQIPPLSRRKKRLRPPLG